MASTEHTPDLRTPGKYHRYKNGKIALTATQRALPTDSVTQSSIATLF
jgi:hypothetical protein